MKQLLIRCAVLAVVLLASAAGLPLSHAAERHVVYLPLADSATTASRPTQPAPPPTAPTPPPGNLAASLVGDWFEGALLPRAVYDPTTGRWGNANGLGQMYSFGADGSFTYQAFFRVENPGCTSEVSVYRRGTATTDGASLILRPATAKTRTATYCGAPRETVTEGPYDATSAAWSVDVDTSGHTRLTIAANGTATTYSRLGMAEALVGTWHRGQLRSTGFYDPASGAFAAAPGEGWWINIAADGTYRWGEYGRATDAKGCALSAWLYMEGELTVAGGHTTFTPARGVARFENACTPDQPRQEPWTDEARGYTWLIRDRQTAPKLLLIPDGRFEELLFEPE